jgi:prevent-host-death family protein
MSYQPVEMSVADLRRDLAKAGNAAMRGQIVYVTSRGNRVYALVDVTSAERIEAERADKSD